MRPPVWLVFLLAGCNLETMPLPGGSVSGGGGDGDAGGDGDGDLDGGGGGDGDGDGDADGDADADADGDGDGDGDGDADVAVCGDGIVEGDEGCDLGAANARVPAYRVTHGARGFDARPVLGAQTGVEFYDDAGTCHSNTGYEADGRVAFMIHQDSRTGERTLVLTLGGDPAGSWGDANVDITGFVRDDVVLLSDDVWDCNHAGDELYWAGGGAVAGRFGWSSGLGDGGVIRLDCPLSLTISSAAGDNVDTLVWIDGDGTVKDIGFADDIVLDCAVDPPGCRDDCTPPTCGDGVLDPGEQCDGEAACPGDCGV